MMRLPRPSWYRRWRRDRRLFKPLGWQRDDWGWRPRD